MEQLVGAAGLLFFVWLLFFFLSVFLWFASKDIKHTEVIDSL